MQPRKTMHSNTFKDIFSKNRNRIYLIFRFYAIQADHGEKTTTGEFHLIVTTHLKMVFFGDEKSKKQMLDLRIFLFQLVSIMLHFFCNILFWGCVTKLSFSRIMHKYLIRIAMAFGITCLLEHN